MSIIGYIKSHRSFAYLTSGIYVCFIISALLHERMLKRPFLNMQTSQNEYFTQVLMISFLSHLFCALIGKTILTWVGSAIRLPWKNSIAVGCILNLSSFSYNSAIRYSSFPVIAMTKSCSLLSVILVGTLCSKVKDKKARIGRQKIWIGGIACAGILCFNKFQQQEEDKPLTLISLSSLGLLISLACDGFVPDIQAQIKAEYKPTSIELYYSMNLYSCLVSLVLLLGMGQFLATFRWLWIHEGALANIVIICLMNAVGQIFVYEMFKQFRQHIPSFVITIRKCITVLLSVAWYHHTFGFQQLLGLVLVTFSILAEIYTNYLAASRDNRETVHGPKLSQIEIITDQEEVPLQGSSDKMITSQ